MVLVKKMPNKVQTAWGTVEPVPMPSGSNKSAAAAAGPAGPSLFSRIAGTFKGATGAAAATLRSAQGKAPVSEARESVKSILRIFASKEWSKLTEVRTVSEAGLAKLLALPKNARTPTDAIYQMIFESFGAYMSQSLLTLISMPVSNQINLINDDIRRNAHTFYDAQTRYGRILEKINDYAPKNAVNRAANDKIGELVKAAWFSIEQLFREREDSFVAARLFLSLQPKNKGAQVAAQQAMQAAMPPPLEISQEEVNISNMTNENWQRIKEQQEAVNTYAAFNRMTAANWENVKKAQVKTLIEQGRPIPNALVYPQPPMFQPSKYVKLGGLSRRVKRRSNKTKTRRH